MARTRTYADGTNIVKTVKAGDKWLTAPVIERNGKLVRVHALIQGKDEHHPEGGYYLDWYEDGRKRRQAVPEFGDLITLARARFIEFQARKAGTMMLCFEKQRVIVYDLHVSLIS